MTNRERILEFLKQAGGPICDDCLSAGADVHPRQQCFSICTELGHRGLAGRDTTTCVVCRRAKKATWLNPAGTAPPAEAVAVRPLVGASTVAAPTCAPAAQGERPWYWEGKVQAAVVRWLVNEGYAIRSVADTESREAGKDIIAAGPGGRGLWVSVKGWPEGSPNTQARHWFAGVLFDLVLWREQDNEVELAVALPEGYATYRNLAARCTWLRSAMPFSIYWVSESGEVTAE